jgi:hypothetical protein
MCCAAVLMCFLPAPAITSLEGTWIFKHIVYFTSDIFLNGKMLHLPFPIKKENN